MPISVRTENETGIGRFEGALTVLFTCAAVSVAVDINVSVIVSVLRSDIVSVFVKVADTDLVGVPVVTPVVVSVRGIVGFSVELTVPVSVIVSAGLEEVVLYVVVSGAMEEVVVEVATTF